MKKSTRNILIILFIICICIGCIFLLRHTDYVQDKNPISKSSEEAKKDVKEKNTNQNKIEKIPKDEVIQKILDVPRFVQETNYYCSCACVQMVLAFHDIQISQDALAQEMNTQVSGTLDQNVAYTTNKYLFKKQPESNLDAGYRVQTLNQNEYHESQKQEFLSRVENNVNHNDPTYLQFRIDTLYGNGITENHQALITGYKKVNGVITELHVIDPYETFPSQGDYDVNLVYQSMIESVLPAYIW